MSAERWDARGAAAPGFLSLPDRAGKPRQVGLTHVVDPGLGPVELQSLLAQASEIVDIVKFGWGTAYVSPTIAEKVRCCRRAGVHACLGGTLLEIAEAQGRTPDYVSWMRDIGVDCVEVSNGALPMAPERKRALVRELSAEFIVLAEVGSKQPVVPSARDWIGEMTEDLAAGARWVIAEGRESGTVGLFDHRGAVRGELVSEILDQVGGERLIFEAPRRQQQAWLITHAGCNINLGNVAADQVTALETLRLGLRADTIAMSCPDAGAAAAVGRRRG